MALNEKEVAREADVSVSRLSDEDVEVIGIPRGVVKPKWYRSTMYNALILGLANFCAPGLWGAMNSLGAGGEEKPYQVNTANALTFCLMVVSCYFNSVLVRYVGIKWALIIGTMGYAPYAAGLYTNNRYGNDWLVLLGAALCGITAGIFWASEAAIALSYPESYNQGKFLGFWLSFRLGGQVVGGAINLGLDANNAQAGKVSYNVYLVFIALQVMGPFVGLLLNRPEQVQRTDGLKVHLAIKDSNWDEIRSTTKLLFSKKFLLIIPLIAQAVYTEAVMFSYEALWFSVRARALGSFLSGVVAIIAGNLLGRWLDSNSISLKIRSRSTFFFIMVTQGAWWIWATILVTEFNETQPTYDWTSPGFGRAFALFLFWVGGFQLNYMYMYFVVSNLAGSEGEVIRICSLLRGTESAVQAVSYGLSSVPIMAAVGGTYINFGLWGVCILPAWFVIREFGTTSGDLKVEREVRDNGIDIPEGTVVAAEIKDSKKKAAA